MHWCLTIPHSLFPSHTCIHIILHILQLYFCLSLSLSCLAYFYFAMSVYCLSKYFKITLSRDNRRTGKSLSCYCMSREGRVLTANGFIFGSAPICITARDPLRLWSSYLCKSVSKIWHTHTMGTHWKSSFLSLSRERISRRCGNRQ